MNKSKATFSVISAGVLWGVISIFIRNLSASGLDSMQITTLRSAFACVIFLAINLVSDPQKLKIKLKDIWMFIGTGVVSVVFFNICYFYTMLHSQASVAVVLLYTSPVFVTVISAFVFKEKITLQKTIALVLTFVGCVLVAGVLGGGYKLSVIVLLTGLGSGLFYALYTIFGRVALEKYDTMTVTAYTFLFSFIGSLPFGKITDSVTVLKTEPSVLLWAIGISVVSTVLPYFLYTYGLKYLESAKAAIFVAVEPLVGAVLGMAVYRESHGILKIIGIALILLAIIILNLNYKHKKSEIETV